MICDMVVKDIKSSAISTNLDGSKRLVIKGVTDKDLNFTIYFDNLHFSPQAIISPQVINKGLDLTSIKLLEYTTKFTMLPDENDKFFTIIIEPKKMSKKQIEKALGYPIEIVEQEED